MRGLVSEEQANAYLEELRQLPGSIQYTMNLEPQMLPRGRKSLHKNTAPCS